MKILAVFGRDAYGTAARGESYEHANILPDLHGMAGEHGDVRLFDCWDRSAFADFAELNQTFVQTIAAYQPDVIFLVLMGYEIWTESLDLIRANCPATLIHWGTDDSWKYTQFTRFIAPHVDLHITTDQSAFERGTRDGITCMARSQWAACSAKLAPPLASSECHYDVSFVGAAYGNRPAWVQALADRGITVDTFGKGWNAGVVTAEDISRIYRQSRVSLNFSDSQYQLTGGSIQRSRQIKARTFEVPGAGGFLLTEPADTLGDYFKLGEEMETYANADELVAKIMHYLTHTDERDAMANRAHASVVAQHTYRARIPALFDIARQHRDHHRSSQTWQLDPAGLSIAVERHACGPVLHGTGKALTWLATLPLGRDRGTRAARRLVHELSWRVAGAKTYSAAGLPGRLFYHE